MLASAAIADGPPRPLIGVIRWDGNNGFKPGDVGSEEERALGPDQWHARLPFWASVPAPNTCNLRGETQAVMDQEIAYAKEAGIDYWAFCWAGDDYYLVKTRQLYLHSQHANDVKHCVIIGDFFRPKDADVLIEEMKAPNYQKVLGDRPLLYALGCNKPEIIADLLRRCALEHVPRPFIAVMHWHARDAVVLSRKLGGNAISAYTSTPPGKGDKGAKVANAQVRYADFAAAQRAQWDQWRRTRIQVIPWVNVGWDPRPRIGLAPQYRFAKPDTYGPLYSMSTGPEFADQLRLCLAWVRDHPASCQANSVLCYSWNEFSEGGTISPKLSGNREHLDAVKEVVAGLQSPATAPTTSVNP